MVGLPLNSQQYYETYFDFSGSAHHKKARMWQKLHYKNKVVLLFDNGVHHFQGAQTDKNYE